ncbi:hypothetical protein OTB20_40065 [Streptomyces sp. H27-H1]|uniref:hypothetical protein n=1 Tax=Streptomyces sp. H27-H1 TaxID=2996461 RepID=UPI00226E3282|nr:hypothetical protein [Streptomyces sp. H27-H1]MCY0932251.1 hypothetical protein [Streptomyces sp. H27-H1]
MGNENDVMDEAHQPPDGVSELTVRALGALSKALETTERARGHLYGFHQLTGTADFELDEAVRLLHEAGHEEHAQRVQREIVGRNVIPGHWTFQIVESYNSTYYQPFTAVEREVLESLAVSRNHLYEAGLKEARRTHSHPDHTATPATRTADGGR